MPGTGGLKVLPPFPYPLFTYAMSYYRRVCVDVTSYTLSSPSLFNRTLSTFLKIPSVNLTRNLLLILNLFSLISKKVPLPFSKMFRTYSLSCTEYSSFTDIVVSNLTVQTSTSKNSRAPTIVYSDLFTSPGLKLPRTHETKQPEIGGLFYPNSLYKVVLTVLQKLSIKS